MNTGFVEYKGLVEQQTHAWLPVNHKTLLNPFSSADFHSKKKSSYHNPKFTNEYKISVSEYTEQEAMNDLIADKPSLVRTVKDPRPQAMSVQLAQTNASRGLSDEQLMANNPQSNGMVAGLV